MSNNHSNNIIEVKDVSIGYSNKKDTFIVSENINFSINKGELISIVGTNGIGKSTLLKTLARIQLQKNGIILLNNKKFNEYPTLDIATQLSIVLTESPSSKNITVKELVSLGRHPYTNWIGTLSENDKKIITFKPKIKQAYINPIFYVYEYCKKTKEIPMYILIYLSIFPKYGL